MATIFIDGTEYAVEAGRNVLQAALDNKLALPYFCWHPAMGSAGACRLCAVQQYRDENDQQGHLTMGCMTPATDGTRVAIDAPEAVRFRRSVIEWLMINHPHDCPVCDEGGECHLQDMTVMTGHAHRRYRGAKRTHLNQYLGPFIHHEMNRCIQCYRCTGFYRDHSGGDDLGVFGSRDRMYFGRVEDGVLESPFAGNLVEVCPTGVFTDKTLRQHYTRKWDLQSAPSICTHCSLGCNTIMGSRDDTVRRVTSRFNGEVNGYWLCDRGRFGYEHLAGAGRLRRATSARPGIPAANGNDEAVWAAATEAVAEAAAAPPGIPAVNGGDEAVWAAATKAVAEAASADSLAVIGSPRASLEANLTLRRLAPARFNAGLADEERALVQRFADGAAAGDFHVASLRQIERANAIVVLGADLTHEAPLLDLAVYRAQQNGAHLHVIALRGGRLEGFADRFECTDAGAAADRADAIGAALRRGAGDDPVVAALRAARRPLVISGTQHRDQRLLEAALGLAGALRSADITPWISIALAECNTLGAVLGDPRAIPFIDIVTAIESGRVSALVVAENDLFARFADTQRLAAALRRLDTLVVLDHQRTATVDAATHALPIAAGAESTGTLVNNEGRMQRFYEVLRAGREVLPTWSAAQRLASPEAVRGNHIDELAAAPEAPRGDHTDEITAPPDAVRGDHVDEITAALEAEIAAFAGITEVAPPAGYRRNHQPIPRQSSRYSGRNARLRDDALEGFAAVASNGELPVMRRPSHDPETPMAFSMEGCSTDVPTALLPRVWAPGWNSNEAINQFQIEVGGPLHGGDPGKRIFAAAPAPAATARGDIEPIQSGASSELAVEAATAPAPAPIEPPPPAGDDALLVYATAEIFGSEPTSRGAPAVASLCPDDYLVIHPSWAAKFGVDDGDRCTVALASDDTTAAPFEATIRIAPALPEHVALIPAGYPSTRWWQGPRAMRLSLQRAAS